jgi:hypothetical protein
MENNIEKYSNYEKTSNNFLIKPYKRVGVRRCRIPEDKSENQNYFLQLWTVEQKSSFSTALQLWSEAQAIVCTSDFLINIEKKSRKDEKENF